MLPIGSCRSKPRSSFSLWHVLVHLILSMSLRLQAEFFNALYWDSSAYPNVEAQKGIKLGILSSALKPKTPNTTTSKPCSYEERIDCIQIEKKRNSQKPTKGNYKAPFVQSLPLQNDDVMSCDMAWHSSPIIPLAVFSSWVIKVHIQWDLQWRDQQCGD